MLQSLENNTPRIKAYRQQKVHCQARQPLPPPVRESPSIPRMRAAPPRSTPLSAGPQTACRNVCPISCSVTHLAPAKARFRSPSGRCAANGCDQRGEGAAASSKPFRHPARVSFPSPNTQAHLRALPRLKGHGKAQRPRVRALVLRHAHRARGLPVLTSR